MGVLDQLTDVGSQSREAGASHRCPESPFTGPYSSSLTMEEILPIPDTEITFMHKSEARNFQLVS